MRYPTEHARAAPLDNMGPEECFLVLTAPTDAITVQFPTIPTPPVPTRLPAIIVMLTLDSTTILAETAPSITLYPLED